MNPPFRFQNKTPVHRFYGEREFCYFAFLFCKNADDEVSKSCQSRTCNKKRKNQCENARRSRYAGFCILICHGICILSKLFLIQKNARCGDLGFSESLGVIGNLVRVCGGGNYRNAFLHTDNRRTARRTGGHQRNV